MTATITLGLHMNRRVALSFLGAAGMTSGSALSAAPVSTELNLDGRVAWVFPVGNPIGAEYRVGVEIADNCDLSSRFVIFGNAHPDPTIVNIPIWPADRELGSWIDTRTLIVAPTPVLTFTPRPGEAPPYFRPQLECETFGVFADITCCGVGIDGYAYVVATGRSNGVGAFGTPTWLVRLNPRNGSVSTFGIRTDARTALAMYYTKSNRTIRIVFSDAPPHDVML